MKLSCKVRGVVLFSLLLVILSSASVFATAFSSNVVIFDWANFSITTDPGVSLNFTNKISSSTVYNKVNSAITFPASDTKQDASAWQSTSLFLGSATDYYIQSTANAVDMTAMAASISSGTGLTESLADSARTAFFTVAGSGNVHVKIPYTLAQAVITTSGSETALGVAKASLDFTNLVSGSHLDQEKILMNVAGDMTVGLFDLDMAFLDNESGAFTIEAFTHAIAYSPVPEPATFVLLGLGIAVITVYRKKIRA